MQPSDIVRRPPVDLLLLALVGVVALLVVGGWLWFGSGSRVARQAEVAARGANVMPFDLERTTHIFAPQMDGGLQQVVADDPGDAEQIALIRSHLHEEAAKFQRGDFSDPAAIHGDGMSGLAALRSGHAQIDVVYSELPDGAQIRYTTGDPAMISALHTWFAAQLSDHGGHAMDHGAP